MWEVGVDFRAMQRFGVEWVHYGGCGDDRPCLHVLIFLHFLWVHTSMIHGEVGKGS